MDLDRQLSDEGSEVLETTPSAKRTRKNHYRRRRNSKVALKHAIAAVFASSSRVEELVASASATLHPLGNPLVAADPKDGVQVSSSCGIAGCVQNGPAAPFTKQGGVHKTLRSLPRRDGKANASKSCDDAIASLLKGKSTKVAAGRSSG